MTGAFGKGTPGPRPTKATDALVWKKRPAYSRGFYAVRDQHLDGTVFGDNSILRVGKDSAKVLASPIDRTRSGAA